VFGKEAATPPILELIKNLSADVMFRVRKAAAITIGALCPVVSQQVATAQLVSRQTPESLKPPHLQRDSNVRCCIVVVASAVFGLEQRRYLGCPQGMRRSTGANVVGHHRSSAPRVVDAGL
jgi:hypothetical protein